jgi:hypothetical protein
MASRVVWMIRGLAGLDAADRGSTFDGVIGFIGDREGDDMIDGDHM